MNKVTAFAGDLNGANGPVDDDSPAVKYRLVNLVSGSVDRRRESGVDYDFDAPEIKAGRVAAMIDIGRDPNAVSWLECGQFETGDGPGEGSVAAILQEDKAIRRVDEGDHRLQASLRFLTHLVPGKHPHTSKRIDEPLRLSSGGQAD